MKLYLAGERTGASLEDAISGNTEGHPIWLAHVKRRLFSYFYHNRNNKPSEDIQASYKIGLDLFLDSGAFTAFSKNAVIPLDTYAEFVKETFPFWTTCSSLDAIGSGEESAKGSRENFLKLRDMGAKVQPVFHVREPDEYLVQYIKEGWDYIFIGGMVPETTEWLRERLDFLWDKYLSDQEGKPVVKTHGFGLTDLDLMFRYPWFSVDSSSWLVYGIYGWSALITEGKKVIKVAFSNDKISLLKKRNSWHFQNMKPQEQEQIRKWMAPYKITPEQCAVHYSFRDAVNASTFQWLENFGISKFVREKRTLFE